jgi:uncharacterized protein
MTQTRERRYFTTEFELRAKAGGGHVIEGHAAVFNRTSQNLGGFVEEVDPSAFNKTIGEADVRALFNHDPSAVLGRNRSETLRLSVDGVGLAYEIDVPDTTVGRDLVVSMERGDITQSSFSFRTIDAEWGLTPDEFPLRRLLEVALYDVGPVTFPAYLDADSGLARSALRSLVTDELDIDAVLAAAASGELRNLISGEGPAPEQTSTPDLTIARYRLALEALRYPGAA